MNRILGFDLGSKTLGISHQRSLRDDCSCIDHCSLSKVMIMIDAFSTSHAQLIKEEKADTIVLRIAESI